MDELLAEFLVESHEGLDQVERALVDLGSHGDERERTAEAFRAVHTIKGTAGYFGLSRLEALTHAGETLLDQLRSDGGTSLAARSDPLLVMVDGARRLLACVEHDGTEDAADVAPALALVEAAVREPCPPQPAPQTAPGPAGRPAPTGPAAPEDDRSPAVDASLHVGVKQLDDLRRLVDELAHAHRTLASHLPADPGPRLLHAVHRVDVVSNELNEGVMRTRLQPISKVWRKAPRIVHDAAAAAAKQVQLRLEGGDTELDRALLDAVRDPLLHLLRNAVAHGIETPAQRLAAGKPAVGTVTLRALHDSGQVVVEVSDDGAGIDATRVGAVARDRRLVPPADLDRMTRGDLLQLVFRPGFTTSATVTRAAGRGVGMDVVRSDVHAIGGTVDLESTPGLGTTCRLRIPLTLAVVPSLVVTVGSARCAVPRAHVREVVVTGAEHSSHRVEHLGEVPVLRLRDSVLSLERLADVLAAGPAGTPDRTPLPPGPALVVVVDTGGPRVGLVVDTVIGHEDVVVTPLPRALRHCTSYSGTTVGADGVVALVLDVPTVCRRVLGDGPAPAAPVTRATTDDLGPGPRLVVVSVDGGRLVGIPMRSVARLDRVPAGAVQRAGDREVVRVRGDVLTAVRLGPLAADRDGAADVAVVVHADGRRGHVALLADLVIDIVDADAVDGDVQDRGLLGATAFGDRVVEVIDGTAAAAAARGLAGR